MSHIITFLAGGLVGVMLMAIVAAGGNDDD